MTAWRVNALNFRYGTENQQMHISVWKYIINIVYLLRVSDTHLAMLSEVSYKGCMYWDITNVCETVNRCKIPSVENTDKKYLWLILVRY
jgi:hypothetical protein